jgi:hypothetical protein
MNKISPIDGIVGFFKENISLVEANMGRIAKTGLLVTALFGNVQSADAQSGGRVDNSGCAAYGNSGGLNIAGNSGGNAGPEGSGIVFRRTRNESPEQTDQNMAAWKIKHDSMSAARAARTAEIHDEIAAMEAEKAAKEQAAQDALAANEPKYKVLTVRVCDTPAKPAAASTYRKPTATGEHKPAATKPEGTMASTGGKVKTSGGGTVKQKTQDKKAEQEAVLNGMLANGGTIQDVQTPADCPTCKEYQVAVLEDGSEAIDLVGAQLAATTVNPYLVARPGR